MSDPEKRLDALITGHPVVIFSRTVCPYCTAAKSLLTSLGARYHEVNLETEVGGSALEEALNARTNQYTVPNIFIGGKHVGGADDMRRRHGEGKLLPMLQEAKAIAPSVQGLM